MIETLESEEIYTLRPEQKLQILSGLCHRIMSSYSVQDFMEEKQREAAELWYVVWCNEDIAGWPRHRENRKFGC